MNICTIATNLKIMFKCFLPNLFLENEQEINFKKHVYNAAISNATILDKNLNWSQLCFLEAYYIKLLSPVINHGLKASKELQLFR